MLLKNMLLESNQVFLFKCSSGILILTSRSVEKYYIPTLSHLALGFLPC